MSAASILRKIAIAFQYGATAIAAAFFLISFRWIGGFLGVLVGTIQRPSTHYIGSIVGVFAAFTLAVGLSIFR
jgi:hypothetical protein